MSKGAVFGGSYYMWMHVDPHLLLFTLLPALLAGDAMTIDTSVAKRVMYQCMYLASFGVVFGAFVTAIVLRFLIDWKSEEKFWLSLCAGSILCATDPVAVVALLKELGASPMLTVQIQGESLLNDGTAIVLYKISYYILAGESCGKDDDDNLKYWDKDCNGWDVTDFLLKKAMMAFALGLFIGYFFFAWMRAASDKLDHHSSMIQIILTLCCAYWSFIFVEGILGLSGVLSTVAASLVLAHHMWPYVVSRESMEHVWHTFEALGNIIVFFLAGSITGSVVIDLADAGILGEAFGQLVAIYIALLVIRACLLFGSRPLMRLMHADRLPVSWQDATLMTWGGLRGAVGLALAIEVRNDRAKWDCTDRAVDEYCLTKNTVRFGVHEEDAERIIFFVSGIAFFTTLINAATAPMLVEKLGITALPQARQTLLKMFHQQLVNWSEDSANPPEVTQSLKHMLAEAEHEIEDHLKASGDTTMKSTRHSHGTDARDAAPEAKDVAGQDCQSNSDLIQQLTELTEMYKKLPKEELQLLGSELPPNKLGDVDDMIKLLQGENEFVDIPMAKVVNQAFLLLVYNNYWKLIAEGQLRPGSPESDVLLTSVRVSLSPYRADLTDFQYVKDKMITADDDVMAEGGALAENLPDDAPKTGCLPEFVSNWKFNLGITVAILLNSIVVCIEEGGKDMQCGSEQDRDDCDCNCPSFKSFRMASDCIFTSIFFIEFALKFAWLKCGYYKDPWNRFDFFLVVVGSIGLVLNLVESAGGSNTFGELTGVIKLARLLRTMRFLRVFRLFNAKMNSDKFVSADLSRHMKKITTMFCFISAHCMAQNDLIKYFGGNGEIDEQDEAEIARCILQSQVSVYEALLAAANTQKQIDAPVLEELRNLYLRRHITESLSSFVEKAHADGAISANEAHAILHPLNHEVGACMKQLNDRAEGVLSRRMTNEIETRRKSLILEGTGATGTEEEAGKQTLAEEAVGPAIPSIVQVPGASGTEEEEEARKQTLAEEAAAPAIPSTIQYS
jgi:NhaP-type Na+/H+ or K+/H+ antiporter